MRSRPGTDLARDAVFTPKDWLITIRYLSGDPHRLHPAPRESHVRFPRFSVRKLTVSNGQVQQ